MKTHLYPLGYAPPEQNFRFLEFSADILIILLHHCWMMTKKANLVMQLLIVHPAQPYCTELAPSLGARAEFLHERAKIRH